MIKTIADGERFKSDAYFMCGANTGEPDAALLSACEDYIIEAEKGEVTHGTAEKLVELLMAAADSEPEKRGSNTIANNLEFKRKLLEYKEDILKG